MKYIAPFVRIGRVTAGVDVALRNKGLETFGCNGGSSTGRYADLIAVARRRLPVR